VGAWESVDITMMILTFVILFGGIVALAGGIIISTFAASAIYSASVRAGMIAGCITVSDMHPSVAIDIDWNLKPVNMGAAKNLFVATVDKIGWVAFPGMILDLPYFPGHEMDENPPLFRTTDTEGWIARGDAIDKINIYHNSSGRGVIFT